MKEEFLHFLWQNLLFSPNYLSTSKGEEIVIVDNGKINHSSGPDFSDARIVVDGIEWAGPVEIHLRSSDWNRHRHTGDPLYSNVILHVVYEHDCEIDYPSGGLIPVLELKSRIDPKIFGGFHHLKSSKNRVSCRGLHQDFTDWDQWFEFLVRRRLERKAGEIRLIHKVNGRDWLQTYYTLLLGYMGQKVNKLPMMELARKLPIRSLLKVQDDQEAVESLLLGVAGFLSNPIGERASFLKDVYVHYKKLWGLVEITQNWKLGRVRPENSPMRRLAQFAGMISHIEESLSSLLNGEPINWNLKQVQATSFWNNHYSLSTASRTNLDLGISTGLGDLLQINVDAPLLIFYSQLAGGGHFDMALNLLKEIPAESNVHTKFWGREGVMSESAWDSQAIIELSTQYCSLKNCVNCRVGKSILSSHDSSNTITH